MSYEDERESHTINGADGDVAPAPAADNTLDQDTKMDDADRGRDGEYDRDGGRDTRARSYSRDRSASPARRRDDYDGGRRGGDDRYGGPQARRRDPTLAPPKPANAPAAQPSEVLGVFGLSIRTRERDLEDEFSRYGRVEKTIIVYDQRTGRSRGFGFVTMSSIDEAQKCIEELNGLILNERAMRVDYSATTRPHEPTPGEYRGERRPAYGDRFDPYSRPPPRGGDRYGDRSYHPGGGGRYSRGYDDRRGGHDDFGRDRRDRYRDDDYERRRSPPRRSRDDDREYRRRYSASPERDPRESRTRAYDDVDAPAADRY